MNIYNSNRITGVSRDMAMENYYNNAQPAAVKSLFKQTASLPQQSMSTPQIYGFTDDSQNRLAKTITSYIAPSSNITSQYLTNASINSLQPVQEQQRETYKTADSTIVTTTPNPVTVNQQLLPNSLPATIIQQDTHDANNSITINKSILIIVISVIIVIILLEIWIKQKRLELCIMQYQIPRQQPIQQPIQPLIQSQTQQPLIQAPVQTPVYQMTPEEQSVYSQQLAFNNHIAYK